MREPSSVNRARRDVRPSRPPARGCDSPTPPRHAAERDGGAVEQQHVDLRHEILEQVRAKADGDVGVFVSLGVAWGKPRCLTLDVVGDSEVAALVLDALGPGENAWIQRMSPARASPRELRGFIKVPLVLGRNGGARAVAGGARLLRPLDALRLLVHDGRWMVGWLGVLRGPRRQPFGRHEQREVASFVKTANEALCQSVRGQPTLKSDEVMALVTPEGNIEFATPEVRALLARPAEQAQVAALVRQAARGDVWRTHGLVAGLSAQVSRLEGRRGARFVIALQRPMPLLLDDQAWLSPITRAVAESAAHGATLPEIARERGVSVETVKTQLRTVYERLGVATRAELARRWSEGA